MKNENAWRYRLIALIFTGVAVLILFQMLRIQIIPQGEQFVVEGDSINRALHIYYPARGNIYDRWGNLLAGSTQVYEVGADVAYVQNPETIAFALSKVLSNHPEYNNADYYNSVFAVVTRAQISNTAYVPLADYVTPDELEELQLWSQKYKALAGGKSDDENQPSLSGLVYRPRMQRTYPEKSLGSNILGWVNREGQGVYGIEGKYNDVLAGEPLAMWMSLDPYRVEEMPKVSTGTSLVLTIDREIQASLEQILDQALIESGAEAGVIIVADPNNGEILGMATTPRMDLNNYPEFKDIFTDETPFNRAVSEDYEPGSVYKVLTMAAALDAGAVEPDTEFIDTGSIEIGGIVIHNWNYGAWGPQNMQGCLQHSLNVCLAWVATQLGATDFYRYMQDFGIGHLTGIEMASKRPGG